MLSPAVECELPRDFPTRDSQEGDLTFPFPIGQLECLRRTDEGFGNDEFQMLGINFTNSIKAKGSRTQGLPRDIK
jgi:hypothetical protein